VALQDSPLQNVLKFCVCICLHCLNLHLVFTNEKGELTIDHKTRPFGKSHNTESLLSDNQLWPQQICRDKNRKSYFLNRDLRVSHHGHLPSYTEDLFSYHSSYPGAKSANKSVPKNGDVQTGLWLCYTTWTQLNDFTKLFYPKRKVYFNPLVTNPKIPIFGKHFFTGDSSFSL